MQQLQQALVQGLLGFEEAGTRMTAAYATQFLTDLADLTVDLPPAAPPTLTTREGGGWHPILLALLTILAVALALLVLLGLGGIALHDLLYPGDG